MKHALISNHTNTDVNIEIHQDSTNQMALGEEARVKFNLEASGNKSQVIFVYGLGVFSTEELSSFNSMIKAIEVETEGDTCKIKGEKLLRYLPRKRQGLFNNKLQIRIENCP